MVPHHNDRRFRTSAAIAHAVHPQRRREFVGTQGTVVLVEDDVGTHDTLRAAFRRENVQIVSAYCVQEAMDLARHVDFDLWIIDFYLPDMTGLDLIRWLKERHATPTWVLMSGFLSTTLIVDAVRLGACEVIEKPVDIDTFVELTRKYLFSPQGQPLLHARPPGGSVVIRWVTNVARGCDADFDPKTLQQWAKCAGVSYTSLCESCRLVGVRPLDARDFMRALRAKLEARTQNCSAELLFDVSDRRTLRQLTDRAGPAFMDAATESILRFIRTQAFVRPEHLLDAVIRHLRTSRGLPP